MSHYCHTAPRRASRRRIGIDREVWATFGQVCTWCARITLLTVLCAAPWWYGGVELDTQVWLDGGVLAALACWIIASCCSAIAGPVDANRLPTLLIPLAGVLILGAAQLSPGFASKPRSDLAVDHDFSQASSPSARSLLSNGHQPQSLYPAATRLETARLGMAMIACYLGIVLFADVNSQRWLWGAFAVNGAALAFFGIVQQLSWNGKLFWTVPLQLGGQPFASFVNRNNAAGYLNLCLAGAIGLTVWSFLRPNQQTPAARSRRRPVTRSGPADGASLFNNLTVTSVALSSIIAAGIICSVSRGGVLALLFAAFVVFVCTIRTRIGFAVGSLFVGVMILGGALVLWTGQEERFLVRWNSSSGDTIESGAQTRLANWRDALQAARDFPAMGTGFGTYSFAYLPYQSWVAPVRFYNADNQFVECLVEGGAIAAGLILASIALWAASAGYLLCVDQRSPCGIVGLFAIASQLVSAFFDFGPTMSANMIALSVFAGVITGRAAVLAWQNESTQASRWFALPELSPAGNPIVVAGALLGFGIVQFQEVSSAASCRVAVRDVPRRLDLEDAMTSPQLDATIQQATTSLQRRPDDAETQQTLARLLIYRYRQQTYRELSDFHKRGGPKPNWATTDLLALGQRRNDWTRDQQQEKLRELRHLPVVKDNLVPAYQHLIAAQKAAPLMPGLDIGIAALALILEDNEATAKASIARAIDLNPADATFIAWCGTLAESAGFSDLATECQNRSLILERDRATKLHR